MTASQAQPGREVWFTVAGHPAPQGSKRALVHRSTGKAVVIESAGQPLRDWRADVRKAATEAMGWTPGHVGGQPWAGPLLVSVIFTLPRPKSEPKTRRTWPDRRPDLDKLLRSTLDAMTGVVFADDAQVVLLEAGKDYPGIGGASLSAPGARIIVREMRED